MKEIVIICSILLTILLTVILVIFLLVFYYKRIKDWFELLSHLYCINPFGNEIYKPKKGDILVRHISRKTSGKYSFFSSFMFKGTMLHFGLLFDKDNIYNTDTFKTKIEDMDTFMNGEEVLYVMQFPKHYYRPIKESIAMFKKWIEEEKNPHKEGLRYRLLDDNCESRIILARIKDEYQPYGYIYKIFSNITRFQLSS
jgi:hypothetical protein